MKKQWPRLATFCLDEWRTQPRPKHLPARIVPGQRVEAKKARVILSNCSSSASGAFAPVVSSSRDDHGICFDSHRTVSAAEQKTCWEEDTRQHCN